MIAPGPFTPVIIKVVPPATPEVSVVDILVDSLGLTGAILLGSLLLGSLLGALFIWISRRRVRGPLDSSTDAGRLDLSSPPRQP